MAALLPLALEDPVRLGPKLLGGGQYFLIGNVIENQFITVGEWNFGSAISMIMAFVMMLLMMLVRKMDKKSGREDS